MGDRENNQPRQPKDLSGLLRLCNEVTTKPEDTTTTTNDGQMDEERKAWLSAALEDLCVSPVDRMKECVRLISCAGDTEEEQEAVVSLIEELTDSCEQIDLANDLYKIGGYQIFGPLLQSPNSEHRALTLGLIGGLVQNNPTSQKYVLDSGLLPTVLDLLDNDPSDAVKVKAIYSVSCLIRDFPEGLKSFEDCDGFSKLMRAMHCDNQKLKVKAAFLLPNLCLQNPAIKGTLCDIGMVDELVGQLTRPHEAFHEHVMAALLSLVTDHDRAKQQSQRPELQLRSLLQHRLQLVRDKDEYREEKEHAEELMKICFGDDGDTECEACR